VNDEPMTKREVTIAREAFIDGTLYYHGPCSRESHARTLSDVVAKLYPLPKKTRPRLVEDPGGCGRWAVKDGIIHLVSMGGDWESCMDFQFFVTAERVPVWADLLANQTEEVEDE
jgi:hypothetical protein